jgi:hypothetical protein
MVSVLLNLWKEKFKLVNEEYYCQVFAPDTNMILLDTSNDEEIIANPWHKRPGL